MSNSNDIASACCCCVLVTIRWADLAAQNHRAKDGDRLVCTGCGTGYVGTDEQVAQVTAADKAYMESEGMTW